MQVPGGSNYLLRRHDWIPREVVALVWPNQSKSIDLHIFALCRAGNANLQTLKNEGADFCGRMSVVDVRRFMQF